MNQKNPVFIEREKVCSWLNFRVFLFIGRKRSIAFHYSEGNQDTKISSKQLDETRAFSTFFGISPVPPFEFQF